MLLRPSHSTSLPPSSKTCSCLSVLRHGDVPRSDWSFPSYTRLLTYTFVPHCEAAPEMRWSPRCSDVKPHALHKGLLRNLHDVIVPAKRALQPVSTAVYIQCGRLSCVVYLTITASWRSYFATSLKMAVSNRVESSTLPPYQSPRRHDS